MNKSRSKKQLKFENKLKNISKKFKEKKIRICQLFFLGWN